jgi:hypothetical protein
MDKTDNIESVMSKGHYLFWASYFCGANLSGVLGETAKGVENILISPTPAVTAVKEMEMPKGAESILPSPELKGKAEGEKAQESQAKSVAEVPKVDVDNKVVEDEPVAWAKLSRPQDLFANQNLLEAVGLNNAMVNILLLSILPPAGNNCSALVENSNVCLFFLADAKGNLSHCVVFQEKGNAFKEYLKKMQITFHQEGEWLMVLEPGKTLEPFGKDFPKKLVTIAEQPSQLGVIEVSAKPQYVVPLIFGQDLDENFKNLLNGIKALGIGVRIFPSQIRINFVCEFDRVLLDLKSGRCEKSSIGEGIDQKNAVMIVIIQNIPIVVDIVEFIANNVIKIFKNKTNPFYLDGVALGVELLKEAVTSKFACKIGSASRISWKEKLVELSVSKMDHETGEAYLEECKSFLALANGKIRRFLKKNEMDAGTSEAPSNGPVSFEYKLLEDYNGFKIYSYMVGCDDFDFDVPISPLPDSAKVDASQDTSSKKQSGAVIVSKDGRRDEETTPSTKQNASSAEANGVEIEDKHGDKETFYVTFYKGEVWESDSLLYLKSVIDSITAKESSIVTAESCIGGFTAETIVKFWLNFGKYLPHLLQQLSKGLETMKKENQEILKEIALLEKIKAQIENANKILSNEAEIFNEVSVKDNRLNFDFSVNYAMISTLIALRSVIVEAALAKFGAIKENKSPADVAPKEAASEKSSKTKETSTPPAPAKTAFNFRLGDVIFGDKQILIPVKILTEYKAIG